VHAGAPSVQKTRRIKGGISSVTDTCRGEVEQVQDIHTPGSCALRRYGRRPFPPVHRLASSTGPCGGSPRAGLVAHASSPPSESAHKMKSPTQARVLSATCCGCGSSSAVSASSRAAAPVQRVRALSLGSALRTPSLTLPSLLLQRRTQRRLQAIVLAKGLMPMVRRQPSGAPQFGARCSR
jgi:hypothetical protein